MAILNLASKLHTSTASLAEPPRCLRPSSGSLTLTPLRGRKVMGATRCSLRYCTHSLATAASSTTMASASLPRTVITARLYLRWVTFSRSVTLPWTPGRSLRMATTASCARTSRSDSLRSALASRSFPLSSSILLPRCSCLARDLRFSSARPLSLVLASLSSALASSRPFSRSAIRRASPSFCSLRKLRRWVSSSRLASSRLRTSSSAWAAAARPSRSCLSLNVLAPASSFFLLYSSTCAAPSCFLSPFLSSAWKSFSKISSAAATFPRSFSSLAMSASLCSASAECLSSIFCASSSFFLALSVSSRFFTAAGFLRSASSLAFAIFLSSIMTRLECWAFDWRFSSSSFLRASRRSSCSLRASLASSISSVCLSASWSMWYSLNMTCSVLSLVSSSCMRRCFSASSFCSFICLRKVVVALRLCRLASCSSSHSLRSLSASS
mmetsp:Transcript_9493/g.43223  ORF Transcript_9493/g.43223 Transcript_9493/m.43223 type:complete len:440 (-) Transcript_9493:780-2099(-)